MDIYKYCLIIGVSFLVITLLYIKNRKIEFNYCILWFAVSLTMFIISTNKNILTYMSNFFGIDYSPSFLFLVGVILNISLIFYLTIKLSAVNKKLVRITQEVGILKSEVNSGTETKGA